MVLVVLAGRYKDVECLRRRQRAFVNTLVLGLGMQVHDQARNGNRMFMRLPSLFVIGLSAGTLVQGSFTSLRIFNLQSSRSQALTCVCCLLYAPFLRLLFFSIFSIMFPLF